MYVVIVCYKQKTAYEMRISDWSSDVCSSDLILTAMRNEPNQSLTGTSMAVSRGPTHVSISIFLQKRNTAIAGSSPWKADMRDMRIFLAKVRSHRFPAALPWPSVWAAIWWKIGRAHV